MIDIRNLQKAYFNIDFQDEYYEGYHCPNECWNGWAVPYFTKEIADVIVKNMSKYDVEIIYDEEKEQHVAMFNDDLENKEIFEKTIIDTIEGKKEVYAIGSCSWIWDDYSLDEVMLDPNGIIFLSDKDNKKVQEGSLDLSY